MLLELAAKCEAAEESDRELDAMIAVAVDFIAENSDPASARELHTSGGGRNSFEDIAKHWPRLLRYTASLDASMTLVPEGQAVELATGAARLSDARVDWKHKGLGKTAALALCAAALRARSTNPNTERQSL